MTSTNHKEQTMDFHVFKTAVAKQFASDVGAIENKLDELKRNLEP